MYHQPRPHTPMHTRTQQQHRLDRSNAPPRRRVGVGLKVRQVGPVCPHVDVRDFQVPPAGRGVGDGFLSVGRLGVVGLAVRCLVSVLRCSAMWCWIPPGPQPPAPGRTCHCARLCFSKKGSTNGFHIGQIMRLSLGGG
jgi:hypothetical protein